MRDLCDVVKSIDVVDITTHNISCFYLASETSYEESIITQRPITPEPKREPEEGKKFFARDPSKKSYFRLLYPYRLGREQADQADQTNEESDPKGERNRFRSGSSHASSSTEANTAYSEIIQHYNHYSRFSYS